MIAGTITEAVCTSATQKRTGLDITVLAGGPGVEREVSRQSGAMVRDALKRLGHRVTLCDISPDDLGALDLPADLVFVALHGEFGEDGRVQRILERRGLAYTGTGPAGSALAMDKFATKMRATSLGIKTPRFDLATPARVEEVCQSMTLPAVVKPRGSGSSVDTFIVRDREGLARSVAAVVEKYGEALVEEYIAGPELTVGVLGVTALPVCEIRTQREFYDYQAKYVDDDTQYLFDSELPGELVEKVQRDSVRLHEALGCRDFSRVDWMVREETGEAFVIEVNTIPGLTSHSLLPKAAGQAGVSFDALCERMVEMAVSRIRRDA